MDATMAQAELPADEDVQGHLKYLKFLIPKLAEYKDVLTHEVNLVVQYLLSAPETPVCLYGIMPDEDYLPHFFLALYPFTCIHSQKSPGMQRTMYRSVRS